MRTRPSRPPAHPTSTTASSSSVDAECDRQPCADHHGQSGHHHRLGGQAYNFVPAAADADHDALKFSISSKPGWATFDAATGRLSGVPTSANAGSYEEIEISVSDGKVVTALPQFAIDVSASTATVRSVQVNWQPPLTNTDGTALTDLKGYRIVYGTQTGVYTNSVPVNSHGPRGLHGREPAEWQEVLLFDGLGERRRCRERLLAGSGGQSSLMF